MKKRPRPPVPVGFPPHLYAPPDTKTFDGIGLALVDPGTSFTLFDFTVPAGFVFRALYYGVFNNGLLASDFIFKPTVNGTRVYSYHGTTVDAAGNPLPPTGFFPITTGNTADLGDQALISAPLTIQPGQRYQWVATNNSAVPTALGVRVVGYLDTNIDRVLENFGG